MVWYPCSPRDSEESSPALQFKNTGYLTLLTFLMAQLSHQYMTIGKTMSLNIWAILGKVCLCFIIHCLDLSHVSFQEASHLIISWLQSPSTVILEPKKSKPIIASIFSPSICHEMIGRDIMILIFLMLSFKAGFSLSFFTLIKRLFSSSSLSFKYLLYFKYSSV